MAAEGGNKEAHQTRAPNISRKPPPYKPAQPKPSPSFAFRASRVPQVPRPARRDDAARHVRSGRSVMTSIMTRGEREDLQRLLRQREKVQKSTAKRRSSELLADFENALAAEFSFDDDAIWAAVAKAAQAEVDKAQKRVAARCYELGIPEKFAPSLNLTWRNRGYDNSVQQRREELRRVAKSRIDALEQDAIVRIEQASVEAQTEIAVAGLTSETARDFVTRLPTVESLMPALSYEEIAGEADPPVIEQLVSPNALRQRRFREKQKALRDGQNVTAETSRNASDESDEVAER